MMLNLYSFSGEWECRGGCNPAEEEVYEVVSCPRGPSSVQDILLNDKSCPY
jgi:hypothetical protein